MSGRIRFVTNRHPRGGADVTRFGLKAAEAAQAFHQSFPEYAPTPLTQLPGLARTLGVGRVYIKDERHRFGLNAFKVLGGSYAVGQELAHRLGAALRDLPYPVMTDPATRAKLGDITFVTATDGNHGRGIAWTANRLGQKAVVYMPAGSSPERLENIRALGAEASVTPWNYDDTVRYARRMAQEHGWVLVQDTAWPGYETVPERIMQGYTTMGLEMYRQLAGVRPTHLFLQAGVGAMAGSMAAFFADCYGADRPVITVVEPEAANCIFRTAQAHDGALHSVSGELRTIMAGLACGEPCSLGWEILRDYADAFVSVPDAVAARGMRILGNGVEQDAKIISGESGAVTLGLVAALGQDAALEPLRRALALDEHSVVVCISTEGDTDAAAYRRIVWDGAYPTD